jgi:hypothetical protein
MWRWAGHVVRIVEMRTAYKIVVEKPEEKRSLGKPKQRLLHIRTDLRETGWEGVDWNHLAQDRDQLRALLNTVMNLRVP